MKIVKNRFIYGLVFFLTTLFLGIMLLVFSSNTTKQTKNWAELEATITKIESSGTGDDTSYYVYVDYIYDSIKYEDMELNGYSSNMHVDGTVKIKVNPSDPSDFIWNDTNTMFLIGYTIVCGSIYISSLAALKEITKRF